MTAPSSNVYFTDNDKSKRIIVYKGLSQICSTNKDESKQSIVNETLLQNYSADVEKIFSTEKDISEYTIREQKDADYEESSVKKEVPSYFNIFECGSIRQFLKFLKLPNNLRKVLLTDISDGVPCLFVLVRPCFVLETQRGDQPLF